MSQEFSELLTIKDVAAWVFPAEIKTKRRKAAPPPLQRGSVWKPSQVEQIWDSIIREFPIGSLLLSPRNQREAKQQPYAFGRQQQDEHRQEYDCDLLDGQQRCTAIALGFLNTWSVERRGMSSADALSEAPFALWVDIAPSALKGLPADSRQFLFRVTSRSHPWGYRRAEPSKTLPAFECRRARDEYKKVCCDTTVEFKAGKFLFIARGLGRQLHQSLYLCLLRVLQRTTIAHHYLLRLKIVYHTGRLQSN